MKSVALLLTLLSHLASAEVMLRVRPHVVVKPGTDVKLAQLIDAEALSEEATRQISEINLSVAPGEGERQELSSVSITSVLRPIVQQERARSGSKVHVIIPKSVTIDTVKRLLSDDIVKYELLQAWQPLCADCRLHIEQLSLPKVAEIRDWTLRIKAELPRGSFSIPVEIIRQDGAPFKAWVSGRLLLQQKVPVAKRILNLNERVQAQDVVWEFRDTSFAMDGIPSEEELVGKQMKRSLRAGEIVWRGTLEKEKAVRRGDLVTVRSKESYWEVSMSVVAQQDAYIGDVVNLKHPKSGTLMVGQVTGQGEVELR